MSQRTISHLQASMVLLMFLSFMYLYGTAGSLETNVITLGQAITRFLIGLVFMAISAITYIILGKEEYWWKST